MIKKIDDNAIHPTYDESGLITDDSQLPTEVFLFFTIGSQSFLKKRTIPANNHYVRAHELTNNIYTGSKPSAEGKRGFGLHCDSICHILLHRSI